MNLSSPNSYTVMNTQPWFGIMKVLEIQHLDVDGTILWQQKNIRNTLHLKGEEFILRAAFTGGRVSTVIPENYYLGLDNRPTISATDEMSGLIGEPGFSGYGRQPLSSSGDFTVAFENNHYQALTTIVAFQAAGGSWGPVQNLFLSNMSNTSGTLISSTRLDVPVVVNDGQAVTMRLGMSLRDCPPS